MKHPLTYLFHQQPWRLLRYIVLALAISIFDVALAYVMAKCIELATGAQLAEAIRYGIGFFFYVLIYLLLEYFRRHQKLRLLQHSQRMY